VDGRLRAVLPQVLLLLYFPYNARLCRGGHEWAKCQASKAGIRHTALDNGFVTLDDPADSDRL